MASIVWKRVIGALLCAVGVGSASAQALGNLATAMKPGEWRLLSKQGDGSGYGYDLLVSCAQTGGDCADNILNFADKGLWNPNTREIHFIGKGHQRAARHIVYSEATARWTEEPLPSWAGGQYGIAHGYEHSSIDPATGNIYLRQFNSTQIHRWSRQTKTWTPLPPGPNSAVAAAIEYFPELGGLLYVGNGEVHLYTEATSKWMELARGLPMGPYHSVATYSPVQKVVVFGGGNGSANLYKIDKSRVITPIQRAPVNVGIMASVFTVDPASGRYLLFGEAGGFYEYDVVSNAWGALSAVNLPIFTGDANRILYRVAVPMHSIGIVAVLGWSGTSSAAYLYKHAPGTVMPPDVEPPPVPSGLTFK